GVMRTDGKGMYPEKISTHASGSSTPAIRVSPKKGRNPTSHKGCRAENIMVSPHWRRGLADGATSPRLDPIAVAAPPACATTGPAPQARSSHAAPLHSMNRHKNNEATAPAASRDAVAPADAAYPPAPPHQHSVHGNTSRCAPCPAPIATSAAR